MASLPKHLTETPTLVHLDFKLTINGGDIRQTAMEDMLTAIEQAFADQAARHDLSTAVSRKLRSTSANRLRLQLNQRGFRIP